MAHASNLAQCHHSGRDLGPNGSKNRTFPATERGFGGLAGGQILAMLGASAAGSGMDVGSIISPVVSGGAGGGALMVIIGVIKGMMAKS